MSDNASASAPANDDANALDEEEMTPWDRDGISREEWIRRCARSMPW